MKDLMNMNANQEPTMSSREIAELTGKRHPDVKRDIKNMLDDLDLDVSKVAHIYLDTSNRKQTEYLLNRELTDCLLTGYSAKLRMIVIKRWHELEQQNQYKLPDFTNPAIAAEAWASEYRAKEQALLDKAEAEHKLVLAAPKVNHYDTVVERTNLVNATQVGSKINMSARKLNEHLCQMNVYNMNVTRSKLFKKWFTDEGYGEVKQTMDGYTQSLFTMKGEAWVIEQLTSEGII